MSSFKIKKSLFPSVCGMRVHSWGGGERENMCVVFSSSRKHQHRRVQGREQTDDIIGNVNMV